MSYEPMHHVIKLKRYEQPPKGYYENFLREFHYRQRAELLHPSLMMLLRERLSSWMSEFRVPAVAYAGVTAIALLVGLAIIKGTPSSTSGDTPSSYASSYSTYSQTPVTIQKMQPVSLRLDNSSMDTGASLPTSYLLQTHPASHELPLSF